MSPEKLSTFIDGVQAAGATHGVDFAVHGPTGPSQSSHRLSALALRTLGPQAQAAVVEELFRGHFERGRDVSDVSWLVSVGRSVGLREDEVRAVVRCEDTGRELEREVRAAMGGGVVAVPSVLVGGRFRVGGYQSADLFEGVFDKYVREQEQGGPAVTTSTTNTPETQRGPNSDWLRLVTDRTTTGGSTS